MAGVKIEVRVGRARRPGTLLRTGRPLTMEFENGQVIIACVRDNSGGKKSSRKKG